MTSGGMITAGYLVPVMSASYVEDAGGNQPTLTHTEAVSAQVEVGVLVSELADRREHTSELGRCTGSAPGAGFVGIESAVHRLDCTDRRHPLALVEDGRGNVFYGRYGCAVLPIGEPLRGPAWFPECVRIHASSASARSASLSSQAAPFRRCGSRNARLPTNCKSRSSRDNGRRRPQDRCVQSRPRCCVRAEQATNLLTEGGEGRE